MQKKGFIDYVRQELESRLQKDNISTKEAESIIDTVFDSIVTIVGSGDEVRYTGVGTFFPKIVQRVGQLVNVKLGFEPNVGVNRKLFSEFEYSALFSTSNILTQAGVPSGIRVLSDGDSFSLIDKNGNKLYTLSEIAKLAGISMPTACKYAKLYKDEIPVALDTETGKRYSEVAVKALKEIKSRNMWYLKTADKTDGTKPNETYTLSGIASLTKISLPSLCKYVKRYGHLIPHVTSSSGRKRYPAVSLEIFRQIKTLHMKKFENRRTRLSVEDIIDKLKEEFKWKDQSVDAS